MIQTELGLEINSRVNKRCMCRSTRSWVGTFRSCGVTTIPITNKSSSSKPVSPLYGRKSSLVQVRSGQVAWQVELATRASTVEGVVTRSSTVAEVCALHCRSGAWSETLAAYLEVDDPEVMARIRSLCSYVCDCRFSQSSHNQTTREHTEHVARSSALRIPERECPSSWAALINDV
eukprot:2641268-Amphidinium_carterae.1